MEERKVTGNLRIENAKLIFKNFAGNRTDFNAQGSRNFGVLLDDETAERLSEDGWPVKYLKPREDDPEQYQQPWMKVKVRFNNYPPIITLINSRGKKKLTEETVDQLDWTIIEKCDLIISPYNYPAMNGRPGGVTGYLKAIYVTIVEDEFEEKYADLVDLDDLRE